VKTPTRHSLWLAYAATTLCLLTLSAALTAVMHAPPAEAAGEQNEKPPAAETDPAVEGEPTTPAQNASELLRDPFWPVGWQPPRKEAKKPKPKKKITQDQWVAARKQFKIQGFSKQRGGGQSLAVVDGNIVQAGERLTTNFRGRRFVFVVRRIDADTETLELRPLEVK